jgi:hypothetical protein
MAGKRQHYLPQFLQRGFASDGARRKTWLYRKGAAAREVGIRDVGVEENFYSNESDTSVDAAITLIEKEEFVATIENARAGTVAATELANTIPSLVAHLEVRSRHLRTTFAELSMYMCNDLLRYLEEPAIAAALVRHHMRRNPQELRAMAAKELRSKRVPLHNAPQLAKQMTNLVMAMPDEELIPAFWKPLMPRIRAELEQRLSPSIKQAHINALAKSVAPEIRVEHYRCLRFEVIDIPSAGLILGDAAVLFEVNSAAHWKPFLDKDDDLVALFLPVSPSRMICGSSNQPAVDSLTICQQVARTSHSFFISAEYSQGNAQLLKEIGTAARPLSEQELLSISQQVISELFSHPGEGKRESGKGGSL